MAAPDEDRAQGIRRLAGGVAHDLGNLLVVISGLSELALKRIAEDAAPRNELERIQRAATRASELARDLLAVARKQALRPREVDLNQALANAQERVRGTLGDSIELELVLGTGAPRVFVDADQLERLLAKLAECLRLRMPDGGRCVLETGAPERAQGFARLTARDSGPVLDPDAEARIFEPYYNPDAGPRLGLALAVVEGIAGQSGGRLRVFDDPAHAGGCFELLLPAEQPHSVREPQPG